ncbi:arginine N-succinyltransferase [Candidatus Eisenbacteria bacterium]|uniref:Arginine N-succinyltransferase n=1 Tax=Eiseniibacteriota bacterium TaxID=2212470 RepID=A0ABV6YK22_UNCEI
MKVIVIVLIVLILLAAGGFWLVKTYAFPSDFKPVVLKAQEEQQLDAKLSALDPKAALEPEPYSEEGADRTIRLTERELNALLAKNTDLAHRVALDLSTDLISAKILIPMEEDFPVLGGKTLRVKAGVEFAYGGGRPIVKLKGVSIWGVPLPNEWLGGMKNIDLVEQYGDQDGFWRTFAAGVDDVRVEEGLLVIQLKE